MEVTEELDLDAQFLSSLLILTSHRLINSSSDHHDMNYHRRVGPGAGGSQQDQRTVQQDQRWAQAQGLRKQQRRQVRGQQERRRQIVATDIRTGRQKRLKICLQGAITSFRYIDHQPVVAILEGYWVAQALANIDTGVPHPWDQFHSSIDTMPKGSRYGVALQWGRAYAKEALQIVFKNRPAAELEFMLAGLNTFN
ncbi:hypothetical protein LTR10_001225 [Elasticomyces elasticus]|nr:hypothetical protein LTR10_001225 [Elasticomyces elasticus]KAK4965408.1 hypothetical protein LTR42_012164 [Elasticomyces elasticus]